MKKLSSTLCGRLSASLCLSLLALCLPLRAQPGMGERRPSHYTDPKDKVVVAYVTSWSEVIPDPTLMTHINYAFGHVTDSFDGLRIDNPDRLRTLVALKEKNPDLRVMLSVGGWGSGNFSQMAASEGKRKSFCARCAETVAEFGLDGIDVDWEYPTSSAAGISSSPADRENFNLLMRDLREALGRDRLLTLASAAGARYIDFPGCIRWVDFVNVMSYDMGGRSNHHSALYGSPVSGRMSCDAAVRLHLEAGVPREKLVMGLPFYGKGSPEAGWNHDFGKMEPLASKGFSTRWDGVGKVPYLVDGDGKFVFGYDDARSIGIKCDYIVERGLLGGMYWEYAADDGKATLARTVSFRLRGRPYRKDGYAGKEPRFKALVLWDDKAEPAHVQFDRDALRFLHKLTYGEGWVMDTVRTLAGMDPGKLKEYSVLISLNAGIGRGQRELFEMYMEEGGGWIGFHASGYHDGSTQWPWFEQFMGCGPFLDNTWPPQPALLEVDAPDHPVTRNLPASFVAAASEWYQWQGDPRKNPDIEVLLTLSPRNYPIGLKDVVYGGDFPVVWTNRRYRMLYLNMGHGDEGLGDAATQLLFVNALRWVVSTDGRGDPFDR